MPDNTCGYTTLHKPSSAGGQVHTLQYQHIFTHSPCGVGHTPSSAHTRRKKHLALPSCQGQAVAGGGRKHWGETTLFPIEDTGTWHLQGGVCLATLCAVTKGEGLTYFRQLKRRNWRVKRLSECRCRTFGKKNNRVFHHARISSTCDVQMLCGNEHEAVHLLHGQGVRAPVYPPKELLHVQAVLDDAALVIVAVEKPFAICQKKQTNREGSFSPSNRCYRGKAS